MIRTVHLSLVVLILMLWANVPALAQGGPVQALTGTITDAQEGVFYDLFGLEAGQIVYVYVEATSGNLDTYLALGDLNFNTVYLEDDDSGTGLNSAFSYKITASGNYRLLVTRYAGTPSSGDYRLLIGINEPDVLNGTAVPTGDAIAVLYGAASASEGGQTGGGTGGGTGAGSPVSGAVQQLTGSIDDASDIVFYDLFGLQAGQVLYVYVEATSGNLDTYLALGDLNFNTVYIEDDDGGPGLNSQFQYAVPQSGDYRLAVTRYGGTNSAGHYRLLIGVDAPTVLSGTAAPTGHEIAALYQGATPGGASSIGTGLAVTDCSAFEQRPTLSGPELIRETQYFVVHYTTSGVDATTEAFVADVVSILDGVWEHEVNMMGWPAPPSDCGEGGDSRYDVYIMETLDVDGSLGYTQPEGLIGDNPNSPRTETWGVYSSLVVDNNFAGAGSPPADLLRATVAHEFHHAIQFGYDLNDIGGHWYYEATATWMETQVFPQEQDATPYIADLFVYPDLCVGATPADAYYDSRIYAEWLLIDSLAQDYGQVAVRRLWEIMADVEAMQSLYDLAAELGTTPQDFVERYAVRNLLGRYDLAERFSRQVRVEAGINGTGQVVPYRDGVQQLGVDYLWIVKQGDYAFSIDQPNLKLIVVGINQTAGQATVYDLGQGGAVDTSPYDTAYLLVLNTSQHADPDSCTHTPWALTVSGGLGVDHPAPDAEVWDASQFVPAR